MEDWWFPSMARRPAQDSFFEEQPPRNPGNRLHCHEEFLEEMQNNRSNTVGRRAALLLQRLYVNESRPFYKSTQGENRGWRRSPLGGSSGNHYYAWWVPRGAVPLAGKLEFEATPEGSVFLRAIRHHDDHRPLNPQSLADNYLPIAHQELKHEDYVPAPWTSPQSKFAGSRQKVRILKGSPGSGKTTALWHAANVASRQATLYVTYSNELAALAREYFDRFAPGNKRFHVVTYGNLVREILKNDTPFQAVRQARPAFIKEISGFSSTILGSWLNYKGALYDEIHAHLIGGALPMPVGRFPGFPDQKITARQYRELREFSIGRSAAEAAVEIVETLRRRDAHPAERFFAELDLAWKAVQHLRASGPGIFADFDCLALDEAQDLTPIESLVVVELARGMGPDSTILVAGDEGQTVRPTDFEWGWFHDLLHHRIASPQDFQLVTNLRSPVRIATVVNRAWDLYGNLAKHERPSGTGVAEIDENAGDQVMFSTVKAGPELDDLLLKFSEREGMAIITTGDEIPDYVPANLRDRVLTSFEAKGLDFQSVCALEAGRSLDRAFESARRGRGAELQDLERRLAIDQLRVVLSRPSERLFWLDVNPNDRIVSHVQGMLEYGNDRAFPVVPALLLKTLEEDTLEAEDRVKLCQHDAMQFLTVRPSMAWSRARQAAALLGSSDSQFAVRDNELRKSVYMTVCQIAFTLAIRRVPLPAEIGRINLFGEAEEAARRAQNKTLAPLIYAIHYHEQNYGEEKLGTLASLAHALKLYQSAIEPWMLLELQPRSKTWITTLEDVADKTPDVVSNELATLYDLFMPLEAAEKKAKLRERSLAFLLRNGAFKPALDMILKESDPDPKLLAQCHEGLGQLELAATEFLSVGLVGEALRCYRAVPDFGKSLELLDRVGEHPAKDSLLWVRRIQELAAERPANFTKVMLPAEKKLLEQILETSLGASRKKPAAKRRRRPGRRRHRNRPRNRQRSYSLRYITKASTSPNRGWLNAPGSRPTISKSKLCHRRTARSLVLTTKLNCMARKPLRRA